MLRAIDAQGALDYDGFGKVEEADPLPYKQCPQCGSWAYSSSSLPYWECPECETDITEVASQDAPPKEAREQYRRLLEETRRRDDIRVTLKRKPW